MQHFNDQYKHPLWQKKRLEIMRRDGWKCTICGLTNVQLHVHHLYYEKDRKIWDYENEVFKTLCSECHDSIHDLKKVASLIAFETLKGNIDLTDFKNLTKVIEQK